FLTLCKIEKASSPDLAQPDVEWPIAIGTKYNELSIRRNRSVPLRTFKIGEPREPCVRKRVLGGGPAAAAQPSGDAGDQQQNCRHKQSWPPAALCNCRNCTGRYRPVRLFSQSPPKIHDKVSRRLVPVRRVFLQCFFNRQPQDQRKFRPDFRQRRRRLMNNHLQYL